MAKQTWIKWAVGLAGVTSFGAFVGALNENVPAQPSASDASQAFDQAFGNDPVQEEWMNAWNDDNDYPNGNFDDDDVDEDDDDEHDDDHHEKKSFDRQMREFAQSQTSGRTRAS